MVEQADTDKTMTLKKIFVRIKPTKTISRLLSVGVGIILISWLLAQLEWSETMEILRNVPIPLLLLGGICYALSFCLRAMRFRLLLPSEQPVKHLLAIVFVHYTALNIIPARLGELSYVYLLKKVNNLSTGYSVSSLIMARVFDQIAISVLFLLSSFFVRLPSEWLRTATLAVAGFLAIVLVLLVAILTYKEKCMQWLIRMLLKIRWENKSFIQRIVREIEKIIAALQELQLTQRLAKILGLSIGIWLSIFSVNYLLFQAFHVPLSYMEIVLASTCIILLSVLPIQVLSGFGMQETIWVGIAMALGISRNTAITAAFGSHIVATLYLCIFGAYGLLMLQSSLTRATGNDKGEA